MATIYIEFLSNNELGKHLRSDAYEMPETRYSEELENYED